MLRKFVCYLCEKQYSSVQESKYTIFDKDENLQHVCKFCESKLENKNYFERTGEIFPDFIEKDTSIIKKLKGLFK